MKLFKKSMDSSQISKEQDISQSPSHETVKKPEKSIIKNEPVMDLTLRKKKRAKAKQKFDDF